MRITDCPATDGVGRSHIVEERMEADGNDAMRSLVADYVAQARELDAVPVLSSLLRRELHQQAAD